MSYKIAEIAKVAKELEKRVGSEGVAVLRDPSLKSLYERIKTLPPSERGTFGQEVNELKKELEALVQKQGDEAEELPPLDVTAPWGTNTFKRPQYLASPLGSIHPLSSEMGYITDIFYRMGFNIEESREIDDDYHMFSSLNFP
ncbi:hypothetical protein BH10PAT3_BH10PAT3_3090 [soil metagenome]